MARPALDERAQAGAGRGGPDRTGGSSANPSFEERAAALVEQMSLEEKISQLDTESPAIEARGFCGVARAGKARPGALVRPSRAMRPKLTTSATPPHLQRLGITAWNWWSECLHGALDRRVPHRGATIFPQVNFSFLSN